MMVMVKLPGTQHAKNAAEKQVQLVHGGILTASNMLQLPEGRSNDEPTRI
jgi:hypothetical protein